MTQETKEEKTMDDNKKKKTIKDEDLDRVNGGIQFPPSGQDDDNSERPPEIQDVETIRKF